MNRPDCSARGTGCPGLVDTTNDAHILVGTTYRHVWCDDPAGQDHVLGDAPEPALSLPSPPTGRETTAQPSTDVEAVATAMHDEGCDSTWCSMRYGFMDERAALIAIRVLRSRGWRPPSPDGSQPAVAEPRDDEDTPLTEDEQRAHDRRTGLLRAQGRLPREDYTVEDMEADGDDA